MRIQPVSLDRISSHLSRTRDPTPADALPSTTRALERLVHLPLGAGIEESEGVTLVQRTVVDDADLHAGHVEDEGGVAGVVAVDEVGVELDVGVAAGLDARVGLFGGGGRGDFGEEGAGGEGDERDGAAAEGAGFAVDVEDGGVGWWGDFARGEGRGVCWGRDGDGRHF